MTGRDTKHTLAVFVAATLIAVALWYTAFVLAGHVLAHLQAGR